MIPDNWLAGHHLSVAASARLKVNGNQQREGPQLRTYASTECATGLMGCMDQIRIEIEGLACRLARRASRFPPPRLRRPPAPQSGPHVGLSEN